MATDNGEIGPGEPHRDPISGTPGAHPTGTGVGAASLGIPAALAGAAAAGPIGAMVGLAVGAVVGGLAGKSVAETLNPTQDDAAGRQNPQGDRYTDVGRAYDDYRPAYESGAASRTPQADPATPAAWTHADATWHAGSASGSTAGGQPGPELTNAQVIRLLDDLLHNVRGAQYRCGAAAAEAETPSAQALLNQRIEACRTAGDDLAQMITLYGGQPGDEGMAVGTARSGLGAKGGGGADSEAAALASCERDEDATVARYQEALARNLPRDVRTLLQRLARDAMALREEIRTMRDGMPGPAS